MEMLLLLTTIFAAAAAVAASSSDDPSITDFPALVTWFRSHGGFIDDRITMGWETMKPSSHIGTTAAASTPNNNNEINHRIRGMLATERIEPETVLIHIPKYLMLSEAPSSSNDHKCALIQTVIDELTLGKESKWHMYFKFDGTNSDNEPSASSSNDGPTRVPTQWVREGQPGSRAIHELQGLPPFGKTHTHVDWYSQACNDSNELTQTQLQALMMFITRAADRGMVPMYDLMNHHNGLINTRLTVDEDGGLSVIATTAIQPNEPIYNTYARGGMQSTVDIFNTYGFVEDYPQLWRWSDDTIQELDEDDPNHAFQRYVNPIDNTVGVDVNGRGFEPNSSFYEILVVSPTLGALHPTKALVQVLGEGQRTLHEWEEEITNHHATLRLSYVNTIHDSAEYILDKLPTTIEEDEREILPNEKRLYEKVKKKGRVDQMKADTIQAIEYRLAFKKALKLAVDIAEREKGFYEDTEEL